MLLLVYALVFCLQGMWDLSSQPGIEPALPALESEVLIITGPPSWKHLNINNYLKFQRTGIYSEIHDVIKFPRAA